MIGETISTRLPSFDSSSDKIFLIHLLIPSSPHFFHIAAIRLSTPSTDINQRIENLNSYFTYYVYTNICRSLFERHKLLFGFLLTIRILQGDNLIDPTEWLFLISGKSLSSINLANPAPDWIDGRMWAEFTALATLPTFAGLAQVNPYIPLQILSSNTPSHMPTSTSKYTFSTHHRNPPSWHRM